ncbi:hypothetical protein ETB97_005906 [Aspergillus alliaceus]|uniref:DUF7791 domain-containing protein n=1 Tax=Petromyces alliaceus TaxID=209559 RepID=A0A8H6E2R1_PETAA|nr:hypothetical protein ETB97_005906 [Aspergillus burnettii]
MTLLRYTFLFDYEIDSNFAMRAEMRGYDLSEADVAIRKVQAQARLNDQSRGLLEIKYQPCRGHLSTKLADIGYVTFIHRSVYDFLQVHHKTHIREACEGFNIVDAMSQMVLAEIKFFGLCSVHSTRLRWLLLKDLSQLLRLCQEEAKDASTFRFFDELDYAVLCAQGLNSLQDHPSQLLVYITPYLERFAQGPHMEITYIKGWFRTNILNTALLAALRWLPMLSPADKILVSLYDIVDFWKLENATSIKKLIRPKLEHQDVIRSKLNIPKLLRDRFGITVLLGVSHLPRYIRQYTTRYLAAQWFKSQQASSGVQVPGGT